MEQETDRTGAAVPRSSQVWGGVGRVALATAAVATAVAWTLRFFLPMARELAGWVALSAPESAQVLTYLLAGR